MTLEDAKAVVRAGPGTFGAVWPLLPDADRDALREWFVSTPDVRPAARPAAPAPAKPDPLAAREQGFTGSVCSVCQGARMKRNGACELCTDCGSSSGCS